MDDMKPHALAASEQWRIRAWLRNTAHVSEFAPMAVLWNVRVRPAGLIHGNYLYVAFLRRR